MLGVFQAETHTMDALGLWCEHRSCVLHDGEAGNRPYYKALLCELKERAEKKIPAILPDGEKYRLYWDGWLPWAFLGMFIRKFVSYGAVPICGRYPWEFFPHPELRGCRRSPRRSTAARVRRNGAVR